MSDITDEELKGMKLQVKKDMPEDERKRIYGLIRKRAGMLTTELEKMKDCGDRPTISYLKQSYNISAKALHFKMEKVYGKNYGEIEATLRAPRKIRILATKDGSVDVQKTVKKLQTRRNIEEAPTLKDVKKIKKIGTAKAIEWIKGIAGKALASSLLTPEQANYILENENITEE